MQVYNLENDQLRVAVKEAGAELTSVKTRKDNTERLWQGNPEIWSGQAPILFPIVGALREGTFYYNGKPYQLPQHGFFRRNTQVKLVSQEIDSLTFSLHSSPDTLLAYPFAFEIMIHYLLMGNEIRVGHTVTNPGKDTLYFSLGGHPAFRCPVSPDEVYDDYEIVFEKDETAHTFTITDQGLIEGPGEMILDNGDSIPLHYGLFDRGALVFKHLESERVSLVSKKYGKRTELNFTGWPFLGIWAKPYADYVCLEPWRGIADPVNSDQQIINKEGMIILAPGKEFSAHYSLVFS